MQSTNDKPTSWLRALLSFMVFLLLMALAGGAIWALWRLLNTTSPEIAAAIIAASATLLVSVFSLIIAKRLEFRSTIDQEHRRQKAPAYTEFLTFLFKTFRSGQSTPLTPEEMQRSLDSFTRELIIWGSNDVLRKFAAFRQEAGKLSQITSQSASSSPPDPDMVSQQTLKSMIAFEAVLYAIRVDLGHDVKDMKPGELMATFFNDINVNPGIDADK